MPEPEVMITWLGGVKEIKPVEYRVTSYIEGPWWWRTTLYAVESEFMRLSEIATRAEAESYAAQLRRS